MESWEKIYKYAERFSIQTNGFRTIAQITVSTLNKIIGYKKYMIADNLHGVMLRGTNESIISDDTELYHDSLLNLIIEEDILAKLKIITDERKEKNDSY